METTIKKEGRKIQAIEVRFLRSMLGNTTEDQIKNDDIRREVKIQEIREKNERNGLHEEKLGKLMMDSGIEGKSSRAWP